MGTSGMGHGRASGVARREVGHLLREWRQRRKLSQLALALDVGVSARHLSFVETGRSRPSPELLLSMSEHLAVPLRQRNELLLAAGYAPHYAETRLDAPDLAAVRRALQRLLDVHDPYPGVALDRHWNVVLANKAAERLTALLPAHLTQPLNMLRASLHPEGFAAVTSNFAQWGRHLLHELARERAATGDATIAALHDEVLAYPNVAALLAEGDDEPATGEHAVLLPCVLSVQGQRLSLFTTQAAFGTPHDVTLAELTVELFYPADEATEAVLRG